MDRSGALELLTPVLHPLELWKETNRNQAVGFELMTIKDRSQGSFVLGGTAEEMIVDLVRRFSFSYRDLPVNLYQFSQKFRDEKRARGGLLRTREFLMKDAYSFHTDLEDCKKEYQNMKNIYKEIFDSLGLPTVAVEADNGYIGGEYSHEFIFESEVGEDSFFISEDKQYAANEEVAIFKKDNQNLDEEEKELQEVDAGRGKDMESGADFHKMPLWQQIKDVMYIDDTGRFILAIIRGDMDVNETKLKNLLKLGLFRPATEEDIREKLHSEPGFISPVKIKEGLAAGVELVIVADDSLRTAKNFYGGANKKFKDLLNINIDRDFKVDVEGDIAMARDGYLSLEGSKLIQGKGIELGHIFMLGDYYTEKMKTQFVDKDGKEKNYYMGCYGTGVDRVLATVVENHHDEKGMIWPEAVAPFTLHLIALGESEAVKAKAEELYQDLVAKGIDVLFDDRDESAGVKFADADLIGIPYRAIVSEKTLAADGIGFRKRSEKEESIIKTDELLTRLAG